MNNQEEQEKHTCSFTDYVYNNNAACTKDGTETGKCSRCELTDTRVKSGTKLVLIDTAEKFGDVQETNWFKDYVDYAVSNNLFTGTSDSTFDPTGDMTRSMFVTVIARIAGVQLNNDVDTKFTDVKTGKWYAGAVKWAYDSGVVNGVGDGKFNPKGNATRAEGAKILAVFHKDFMN